MFKTILVPVDGSEAAHAALDQAIELQKLCDAELLILSVYREHNLWKASMTMVRDDLTRSTDEALEEFAREVAERSKAYVKSKGVEKVRSFYMGGGPARMIVKFSEDHGADLIVMGSRGMSDSTRYLLGSVSHKVTSLAQCPVMVI
jgi:nucleotide-binding universal stress UspA family protein